MKRSFLLPVAAFGIVALAACGKSNTAAAKRVAELERQNREVIEAKQQLERQLAEQQLASEREAIERERMRIEDERAALEEQRDGEAAAKQEALAAREQELARREGNIGGLEAALEDKQETLQQQEQLLSGRELELAGSDAPPETDTTPAESLPVADYGTFYDSLAPYGSWLETPDYGYVWQPAVVGSLGWRPYTDGRWVCTDHGWTWISNEPFGWACYHYGRWAQLRDRGWIWVPGDQWAPAWVCWRGNSSHIGWAPLPPESLGWRNCTWDRTVETRFGIHAGWFNFVPIAHFSDPIRRHCLPVLENTDHWEQTADITNIRCRDRGVFVGGPRYQDISRALGRPAPYYQLNLNEHQRPGPDPLAMRPRIAGKQINIAAPAIHADWNAALRPSRVREQLQNAAIERPNEIAPEVVEHLRQNRELDSLQANQALTQLGGREGFRDKRAQVLAANQAAARATQAQPGRQLASPPAAAPSPPEPPQIPARPDTTAARQPGRPNENPPQVPAATANGQEQAQRQQQAEAINQQRTAQAEALRQQQAEAANQQKSAQAAALHQRGLDDASKRQAKAAAQQKDQQAEGQRQRQAEAANQQRAAQAEALRQQQAEAANQQKAAQAEALRQRAAEEARQRQAEAANQQRAAQAEALRQQQAEAANQQKAAQADALRHRAAEEANQQRAQQAEAQRQRAAEEARQRQQQDDKKKQDDDSRQRRPGR